MRKFKWLLGLPIIVLIYFIYTKINVSNIDCVSQFTKCSPQLANGLSSIKKGRILDTSKQITKFLNNEPLVKKYSIQFKLDGSFVAHVQERAVKFCLTNGEKSFFTDDEAIIIKTEAGSKDGCLSENGVDYKLGDKLEYKEQQFQELYYDLRDITGIGQARIDGDTLNVKYKNDTSFLFSTDFDVKLSAGKAYYIASQFDIIKEYIINKGFTNAAEIDFRYNNPVIRVS